MARVRREVRAAAALTARSKENVVAQLEGLRRHPSVARAVASGGLELHGWLYLSESGTVLHYRPESGDFAPFPPAGPS